MKDKIFVIFTIFLLISSCKSLSRGTPSYVFVNSFVAPNLYEYRKASNNTFTIVPLVKDLKENDFEFLEYAEYTKQLLMKRGYKFTSNKDEADIIVGVYFGISGPQIEETSGFIPISTYIPGQTYHTSSFSYGTGTIINTTLNTPSRTVTDYVPYKKKTTKYIRQLVIDCYDYKQMKESKGEVSIKLWSTEGISEGTNGDMRIMVPTILTAMNKFFEKNSGKQEKVIVRSNDSQLISLKKHQLYSKDRIPISKEFPSENDIVKDPPYCSPIEKIFKKSCKK